MTYKVVKYFTDLQDNGYAYHAGDTFPRDGLTVSPERLDELSSNENRRGVPLIEKVFDDEPTPEPVVEDVPEPVVEKPKSSKKSGKKEKVNKDAE